MSKQSTKADRANAERAAEHFARERFGCVVTVRAVRTQWQRQDLFAGDCMGKTEDGTLFVIQATAGQHSAVTARRRKLEKIPWASADRVFVVQMRQTEDPANARKRLWWFRVHEYKVAGHFKPRTGRWPAERIWTTWEEAVPVPRSWFKAWKEGKGGDEE